MAGRVAIVGTGISGLVAGAMLAKLGYQVTLLERAPSTGPLLRGFRRHGVLCDTGFHYSGGLGEDGILTRVFNALGVSGLDCYKLPESGFDRLRLVSSAADIHIPIGFEAVGHALAEAFPDSLSAVRAYVEAVRRIVECTPYLNPELPSWQARMIPQYDVTLASFLKSERSDGRLLGTLSDYGEYLYGMRADETSLLYHARVLGSYYTSANGIRGGGEALVEALTAAAVQQGASIRCSTEVSGLAVGQDGALIGAILGGSETLEAEIVIFTGHPHHAVRFLEMAAPGRFETYRARLLGRENTPGVLVQYLEDQQSGFDAEANYYLVRDQPDLDSAGMRALWVALMAPSAAGGNANSGRVLMTREMQGPDDESYAAWKRERASRMRDRARSAFPEMSRECRVLSIATPSTYERWTASPGGAIYGAKHRASVPQIRMQTPLSGFFLAGQSVLMPGIMGAAISGLEVCNRICRDRCVWKVLGP